MYDLKIRGAEIVDGSGAPRSRGDLGVVDGKIVAVGDAPDAARRTIDADGLVAAPGFVDVHTHLDAQVFFDPLLGISSWHGVTTVIAGNCGFGIAPTRPEFREVMMHSLESVEGMDYDCLREGLGDEWGFVTFPEYLDAVSRKGVGVNFAAYVGHTPVRLFVMGEAATERAATPEEIQQMAAIVREAIDAGAIGFSTSKVQSHIVWDGRPAPSRQAELDEIVALADGLGESGRGVFMCALGPGLSIGELMTITTRTGRPATFAGILTDMGGPGQHRRLLDRLDKARAEGHPIIGQISSRPLMVEFSLFEPYMLTNGAPAVMRLPTLEDLFSPVFKEESVEGKLAAYQDATFRAEFRRFTDGDDWLGRIWRHMVVLEADDKSLEQRLVVDIAAERGVHPSDVLLDLSLTSKLQARFGMGYVNTDEAEIETLLTHPGTQIGLSDSGAHINQICDACYPTDFLARWVRERQAVTLEEGIAMLASRPAAMHGLADRGILRPGYAADIVLFDLDEVRAGTPRRVRDLPADTPRLVADAIGIEAVIVNGTVIRHGGDYVVDPAADRLPGEVIRSRP